MKRFLPYSIEASNDQKRAEVQYRHSIDDLISWGSSLLQQGKKEKAIEVFKLSVALNPGSADAYEKLAEAYEGAGNKEFAVKNFKQSLQLDPDNTNAKDHLKKLLP